MKGFVLVALFAFVAVQLCQGAPMPDEEKKVEVSVAPVAVEASSSPPAEVKSDSPHVETSVAPVETTVKVEEKKV